MHLVHLVLQEPLDLQEPLARLARLELLVAQELQEPPDHPVLQVARGRPDHQDHQDHQELQDHRDLQEHLE